MQNVSQLMRSIIGVGVLSAAMLAGGCQTMEKATEMAKKVMPGGDDTDLMALSEKMIGNTAIDVNGKWHSYVSEDGQVMTWTDAGGVEEGTWRKDENGIICQTMAGVETCLSDATVSTEEGVYMQKSADGKEMSYRIVSGNSKGL